MVLPLIGALAGAGGSIASALIGAGAEDEANQYNWMVNLYNLRQREKERNEARAYADKLRGEQKLGATDAMGNRTYFKEGVGWVSELGPQSQELQDYFFSQELPERRAQFERRADASREEADIANALLGEFRRVTRQSPADIERMLYAASTRGINDATREALEPAMRSALRSGTSNVGRIAGEIGKQGMDARRDAALDAKLQARDYADKSFATERGGLANLYQLFASRAGGDLGASFDPAETTQQGNALLTHFANLAQQGNSQGFNAAMKQGGTLDYIQPNLAWANAAGAIGQSMAGLGDRVGSYMSQQQNSNLLRDYITQGGALDLNRGALFGAMTDRVRPDGGLF